MTKFRKAPEGQPTSNIELQLNKAELSLTEWEINLRRSKERVESAEYMIGRLGDRVAELKYQLEQRKSQEVNGL